MAQLKSTSIFGNLNVTGSIISNKFVKLGGTNGQLLLADGSVCDTSTFASSADITAIHNGYLPKSGGTLTGKLTLASSKYADDNTSASYSALELQNSNITGVNAIYMADTSDSSAEGIHFVRDNGNFDSLWAKNGTYYLSFDRAYGGTGTTYTLMHSGNYTTYAPTKDGTGASGTWGISISGNAATASSAATCTGNAVTASALSFTVVTTQAGLDDYLEAGKLKYGLWKDFTPAGGPPANGLIISGGWTANATGALTTNYGFQIAIDDDPTHLMYLRQRNADGWATWKQIPMGDGTGASGTWSIDISGTAEKATKDGSGNNIVSTYATKASVTTVDNKFANYLPLAGGTMTGNIKFSGTTGGCTVQFNTSKQSLQFVFD